MNRSLRMLAACAPYAVLLPATPAQARVRGEVIEYGETTAILEHAVPPTGEDHVLLPRTAIEGIRFISHTDRLEGQLCLRFGVSIRLTADGADSVPEHLIVRVTHPILTRPDGVGGTQGSFSTTVDGVTAYAGWTFDQGWELRPGRWTFAFTYAGETLASKTLKVSVAKPPGSICPSSPVS